MQETTRRPSEGWQDFGQIQKNRQLPPPSSNILKGYDPFRDPLPIHKSSVARSCGSDAFQIAETAQMGSENHSKQCKEPALAVDIQSERLFISQRSTLDYHKAAKYITATPFEPSETVRRRQVRGKALVMPTSKEKGQDRGQWNEKGTGLGNEVAEGPEKALTQELGWSAACLSRQFT